MLVQYNNEVALERKLKKVHVGFVILLLILILCSMLQDASELNVVKVSLSDGGLTIHLIHLQKR